MRTFRARATLLTLDFSEYSIRLAYVSRDTTTLLRLLCLLRMFSYLNTNVVVACLRNPSSDYN